MDKGVVGQLDRRRRVALAPDLIADAVDEDLLLDTLAYTTQQRLIAEQDA
ncbi:MAG: hypothetical protein R3C45_02190 [Phycisphaerales bacterium]